MPRFDRQPWCPYVSRNLALLFLFWARPFVHGGSEQALASLPPMGYNSWNDFDCKISAKKLLRTAETLEKLGFLQLGYQYFVVGDCWMKGDRDENGRLTADPNLFPNGMPSFVKQVKSLGFKFGIHTCRGPTTCVGLPASMGKEEVDAQTFADWGVDLVRNDGCWDPDCGEFQEQFPKSGTCPKSGRRKAVKKYIKMAQALRASKRQILHAVAGGQPWYAAVGPKVGHTWRVAADIRDWEGVYETTRVMEQLVEHSGPGGWNDADMLLGSSSHAAVSLTQLQSRAQFSLWAVMSSPLMLGAHFLETAKYDVQTYTNKEVIRINQDRLMKPGKLVYSTCPDYPKFKMSVADDGITPEFEVPQASMYSLVACGSHSAKSCADCPKGNGEGWCHGECRWMWGAPGGQHRAALMGVDRGVCPGAAGSPERGFWLRIGRPGLEFGQFLTLF